MNRILMAILLSGTIISATPTEPAAQGLDSLIKATNDFLGSLDTGQRSKAQFEFETGERMNWHYVPKDRRGIPLREMKSNQEGLVLKLLRTALSEKGLRKAETIRELEVVLQELEGSSRSQRDPEAYYVTVFGEPSQEGPWGLRYEGHHLSLNWTVLNGSIVASTPQFLGANPAEVPDGAKKGTRVLSAEEDLARELAKSLDEEQAKLGILEPIAPREILTGADRQAAFQEDLGIPYSEMGARQKELLFDLITEYAVLQHRDLAEARLDEIREAGLDDVKFAWMGGLEKGEGHYYRIQGKTFLIEYDNTQNDANHIHCVWRDFDGDFGLDVLKRHYEEFADASNPDVHRH